MFASHFFQQVQRFRTVAGFDQELKVAVQLFGGLIFLPDAQVEIDEAHAGFVVAWIDGADLFVNTQRSPLVEPGKVNIAHHVQDAQRPAVSGRHLLGHAKRIGQRFASQINFGHILIDLSQFEGLVERLVAAILLNQQFDQLRSSRQIHRRMLQNLHINICGLRAFPTHTVSLCDH